MHQDLADSQRQQRFGRGVGIDVRAPGARRPGQGLDHAMAAGRFDGVVLALQVAEAPQRDHSVDLQGIGGPQRAGLREPRPGRRPQGEVSAGGVAHRDHAIEPQAVFRGRGPQQIDRRRHVREGAGITAPRLPHAAIFDVPDRHAPAGEIGGGEVHQLNARQVRSPAAAVQHHRHWEGARPLGQPQLDELRGRRSIGDVRRRLERRALQEVLIGQAVGCRGPG